MYILVHKNTKILDTCSANSAKYLLEKKTCIYDIDTACLYFIIKHGFYIYVDVLLHHL